MDIVDASKDTPTNQIRGNNNEMDVLNTQLAVASRLQASLLRNSHYRDIYELQSDFSCDPFTERFENNLAGWAVTFTISVQNDMTSA
jgi:hypothetical protein